MQSKYSWARVHVQTLCLYLSYKKKRDEIFRYNSLNKHQLNFTDLVREVKKKFIVHFMLRLVEYLCNC